MPSPSQKSLPIPLHAYFTGILVFTVLVSAGFVAFLAQFISYILLRPLSLSLHRRISVFFNSLFFLCAPFILETFNSVTIVTHGAPVPPSHPAICLMNHVSDVDMLLGLTLLSRYGHPYPGNAKAIIKSTLSHVPIFGWLLLLGEFLPISRSWAADRRILHRNLRSLLTYPHPVVYVLWPEGSRQTPAKLATSQAYARSLSLPVFSNVLLPRFKAFLALLAVVRASTSDICDITLCFAGPVPRALNILTGTCRTTVHVHLARHAVSALPEFNDDVEKWLVGIWGEKDARIADFNARGPQALGEVCREAPFDGANPSLVPFYALAAAGYAMSAGALWASYGRPRLFWCLVGGPPLLFAACGVLLALVAKPSSKGLSKDQKTKRPKAE